MKVFFARADDDGSGYYRSRLPAIALAKNKEFEVRFGICSLDQAFLYESDIVIMHRQFDPAWLEIMDKGRARGCKYIFELDDDIFNIPEGLYNRSAIIKQIETMRPIIKKSDAVITSTEPIAEQLRSLNNKVFILPNYIIEPVNKIPEKDEKVRIGWSGSASHSIDFDNYILNALETIKKIYKDKVSLIFHGWIPRHLIGKVSFFRFIIPTSYMSFLRDLNFDIGIIPCKTTRFNHARSNLKYLEYSINETATIASPVYPYTNSIQRDAGMIVRNKYKNWLDALTRFIEDETYRKESAQRACSFVKEKFMLFDHVNDLKILFNQIAEG